MRQPFLTPATSVEGIRAEFIGRIATAEVGLDRDAVVAGLQPYHQRIVAEMGFNWSDCWRAEQVHGAEIAVVKRGGGDDSASQVICGVDGMVTNDTGVLLGIYVADCAAVYLVDRFSGAIGLLHSGKKGTELGILPRAISVMQEQFGTNPEHLIVTTSPCIRPPAYEVDFARQIFQQAMDSGVQPAHYYDSGICTSSDLTAFYSYRLEQGCTGRMLALLGKNEGKQP